MTPVVQREVRFKAVVYLCRFLVASALIWWHWEAKLISFLSSRKTNMPFSTLEEMYQRTDFRLALIPATSYEDNFKYSNDPIWKAIYAERLQPYLEEYKKYPNDMIRLVKDDFTTALYESFIPVRYSDFLRNMHVAKF